MKVVDVYREYKMKYPKFVILIRVGNFYEIYGEDAYIMNNLFNYKVKKFDGYVRAGFPIAAYNKVMSKFNSFKINYLIIDNKEIMKKKFNKNNYEVYLKFDLTIDNRISRINERLIILKESGKIGAVLSKIEEVI